MDATYKTSKLATPLFFLCVKTNCGYSVVCSFVVEQEDAASISEALKIIKSHLDANDVQIQSFMIDSDPAEQLAIRQSFEGLLNYF